MLLLAAFRSAAADGALVLTQIPTNKKAPGIEQTILDQRYPTGSRVILIEPPFNPNTIKFLSAGLDAAGGPVASADGKRIYFTGKILGCLADLRDQSWQRQASTYYLDRWRRNGSNYHRPWFHRF